MVPALVAAFTLVEPRTKLKAALEAKRAAAPSFGDAMRELRTKRTFWLVAFAGAIKAFIGYGSAAFIVSFFLRNHSAELAEVSASFGLKPLGFVALVLGVVAGVAGAAGTWLGGFLGDRFGGRDLRFNMAMPAIATLVSIPFYVFGLLTESLVVALVVLAIPPILNTLWYGPVRDGSGPGAPRNAGDGGGHSSLHHQPYRPWARTAGDRHHQRSSGFSLRPWRQRRSALGSDRILLPWRDRLHPVLGGPPHDPRRDGELAMSNQTAGPAPAPLAPAYRRYALGVLLAIYTLNFLDRQIVTILAEPIRNDLGLKDWQLGMMTGFAFALLYTVMGIPIARYAERANRPFIIATATAVWSLFTVFCGMATNFVQLILARVGVGIGEAGCAPPAHSLISDYVPKEKRASAMAFYHLGTPLGSLLGLVMGGLAADLWGWRTAFLIAGVPGIVMAVVAVAHDAEGTAPRPSPRDRLGPLSGRRAARTGGQADLLVPGRGGRPDRLQRLRLGSLHRLVLLSQPCRGTDRTRRLDRAAADRLPGPRARPLRRKSPACSEPGSAAGSPTGWAAKTCVPIWSCRPLPDLPPSPIYVAGLLLEPAVAAIVVLTIPTILASLWYGPVYSSVQGLVRPQTRATASAILLFIINLIGLGLGPLGIGMLSDVLAGPYGMGAGEGNPVVADHLQPARAVCRRALLDRPPDNSRGDGRIVGQGRSGGSLHRPIDFVLARPAARRPSDRVWRSCRETEQMARPRCASGSVPSLP